MQQITIEYAECGCKENFLTTLFCSLILGSISIGICAFVAWFIYLLIVSVSGSYCIL